MDSFEKLLLKAEKLANEMDEKNEMSPELIKLAEKCDLLNPDVKNLNDFCEKVKEIAKRNQSLALSIVANSMTYFALQLSGYQTGYQSDEKKLSCFALTEPRSGSDIKNLKTTFSEKVEKVIGTKTLVTNAELAEVFTVLAKCESGSVLCICSDCYEVRKLNVSCFRGSGISAVKFDNKTEIVIKDGVKLAMEVLNYSRPAFSAIALGISEKCLEIAINYAKRRKAFGKRISDFQALKFSLADCMADVYSLKCLIEKASYKPDAFKSAVCKLVAAKTVKKVTDTALQVIAGHGLIRGCYVERAYRDAKAFEIGEGTSEVMKLIISREF